MITGAGTISAAYITADMTSVIVSSVSKSPGQKANVDKFIQYLIICLLWFGISAVMMYLFTINLGNTIFDSTISWQQAFLSGAILVGMLKGNKIAGSTYSKRLSKMMSTFESEVDDIDTDIKEDNVIDPNNRPD